MYWVNLHYIFATRALSSGMLMKYIHANNCGIPMFRASPWVNYGPATDYQGPHTDMDREIDMDAPQISTLREEATPPPQIKSGAVRKGKQANKPSATSSWPRPRPKKSHTDEEYDEVEEEEDQLIDDDDDMMKPLPPASLPPSGRSTDPTSKRKTPTKRKRKSEKRTVSNEKASLEKANPSQTGAVDLAPRISCFSATPSEMAEDPGPQTDGLQVDIPGDENISSIAKEFAPSTSKSSRKVAPLRTKKTPK